MLKAFFLATFIASTIQFCLAQQYAGASYNNSLPSVPGAQIAFWNIKDPNNKNATLLTYATAPNGKQQIQSNVQRAVIVIHGLQRDPWNYMSEALSALSLTTQNNPSVNTASVSIVAPYFADGDDKSESAVE